MTMPVQKPHSSKQAVGTPDDFLEALQKRFGKITIDLAAHKANHVVDRYFAPEYLTDTYVYGKTSHDDIVLPLMDAGADGQEASDLFQRPHARKPLLHAPERETTGKAKRETPKSVEVIE